MTRLQARREAALVQQRVNALPDYNDFTGTSRDEAIATVKKQLGEGSFNRDLEFIRGRQDQFPELMGRPTENFVGLHRYTHPEGSDLSSDVQNTAIRNGGSKLAKFDAAIRLASTALEALPAFHGVTFRGIGTDHKWLLDNYKRGELVLEKSFTSTSTDLGTALRFAASGSGAAIFVVKGQTGRDIQAVSRIAGESEVLFRPNTMFRVLDSREADRAALDSLTDFPEYRIFQDRTDVRLVFLEEVPRSS